MKVALDLDDGSIIHNRLDLLKQIKEHYPNFKVSLFFIPLDYKYETVPMHRARRESLLKELKKELDWIQLIPHGVTHMAREFLLADRKTTALALQGIDDVMHKDELPYEKGFKAPFWLWNQEVVDVLNENGWWGAVDRNQPQMVRPNKFYEYNFSLDEPFWESTSPVLKIHGHIDHPSANNLDDCFLNIFKLPADTEFCYVTDFLETK